MILLPDHQPDECRTVSYTGTTHDKKVRNKEKEYGCSYCRRLSKLWDSRIACGYALTRGLAHIRKSVLERARIRARREGGRKHLSVLHEHWRAGGRHCVHRFLWAFRRPCCRSQEDVHPHGAVYASFGPTWYHPLGGHLFSVFPWAHPIFSEKEPIRQHL